MFVSASMMPALWVMPSTSTSDGMARVPNAAGVASSDVAIASINAVVLVNIIILDLFSFLK